MSADAETDWTEGFGALGRDVLDVLRWADGVEEVFGRVLDLDDAEVGRLVREFAAKRGVYSSEPQPSSGHA